MIIGHGVSSSPRPAISRGGDDCIQLFDLLLTSRLIQLSVIEYGW